MDPPAPSPALLPTAAPPAQLPPALAAQGWTLLTTGSQWRAVHRDGRTTPWRRATGWVSRDIQDGRTTAQRKRRPRAQQWVQHRLFDL